MKNSLYIIIILTVIHSAVCGQTASNEKHIQPKIIVIPRVAEGQDMKKFYDSDINMQIAIAKINEAFQKRGANLKSFDQTLKQVTQNANLNKAAGNQEDYKSMVLQSSGADIYVETKLSVVNHSARNANSVTVILDAYQTGTANSLASRTVTGPMFQTDDIGKLTMMAMDTVTESFLNLMQLKFDDIVTNGQSVYVEFTISPNSKFTFDSEIGAEQKLLSDVVDEWFQNHSINAVYNSQGVVGDKLIISDARVPLRNPVNPNVNYTGQNLYSDLYKYFKSINVPIKREIGTNNKILITIL